MRTYFEEVTRYGRATWKVDGKRRTKRHKVTHTINPWNRNDDGTVRSREEVTARVEAELQAWIAAAPEGETRRAGW